MASAAASAVPSSAPAEGRGADLPRRIVLSVGSGLLLCCMVAKLLSWAINVFLLDALFDYDDFDDYIEAANALSGGCTVLNTAAVPAILWSLAGGFRTGRQRAAVVLGGVGMLCWLVVVVAGLTLAEGHVLMLSTVLPCVMWLAWAAAFIVVQGCCRGGARVGACICVVTTLLALVSKVFYGFWATDVWLAPEPIKMVHGVLSTFVSPLVLLANMVVAVLFLLSAVRRPQHAPTAAPR